MFQSSRVRSLFRPFWYLLAAIGLPIALTIVLLLLIYLIDHGSDAPLVAAIWWSTLHLPFYVALLPTSTAPKLWLTIAQWILIATITGVLARNRRTSHAIAIAFGTIVTVGVMIVIVLVYFGYGQLFEGI